MNIHYMLICCTEFPRFSTVYGEQPVTQVKCVSYLFIQVQVKVSYLCLHEPINYSFLWTLQFFSE